MWTALLRNTTLDSDAVDDAPTATAAPVNAALSATPMTERNDKEQAGTAWDVLSPMMERNDKEQAGTAWDVQLPMTATTEHGG